MAAPLRLLVVCLGNICRSPMAEGALRKHLAAAGLDAAVEVDSAGLGRWHVGQPPDRRAIACAAGHGVDIAGQRARQLQAADFERFDWLLCADADVLREVRALSPPSARKRAVLLLDHAGGNEGGEVPDPYAGTAADFEHAWILVDAAAAAIAGRGGRPAPAGA